MIALCADRGHFLLRLDSRRLVKVAALGRNEKVGGSIPPGGSERNGW